MSKERQLTSQASKMAVIQVLAALIQNPLLFNNSNYRFAKEDFPERFHEILFGAIEHLALSGMGKIDYIDIDQFLKQYPVQYKVFIDNQGPQYVQRALSIYEPSKFKYYYETLKKYSLLNSLMKQGIDTSEIYDADITDPVEIAKMQEKFDSLSTNDILAQIENKIILAKEQYSSSSDIVKNKAGDGLLEYKNSLKKKPIMGMPFTSPKLTTIFRGLRLGALYVESAGQGTGKSRRQASESAHLAVSEIYNTETKTWDKVQLCRNVLLISTELELKEVQTMWVAYISGVEEDKITDGTYVGDEEKRVDHAIELIDKANLYFVSITNYDIDDIENLIKLYYQLYGVEYVFYDYLSTTIKIMAESSKQTKIAGLREDQILLAFVTRLKDLAKTLGVAIWTATQLSGDWNNAKEIDQQLIRGAKAISDKPDCCSIMLQTRASDDSIIASYCARGFELTPTHVIYIYKMRRGKYSKTRLYVHYDLGTCRMYDCFTTNKDGKILDIDDTEVNVVYEKEDEEESHIDSSSPIITTDKNGEVVERDAQENDLENDIDITFDATTDDF